MGFAGNLRTLGLVEVFQTLNRIKATGALRLASAEGARDAVFLDGEIIGVGFRGGEHSSALLRRLILLHKLDAQVAAAISGSGNTQAVLDNLIQRGLVSDADLADAIHKQTIDELHNLWTWDYADFVFQEAVPDDPEAMALVDQFRSRPLKLNINSLLMESARRMDEWERLRSRFETLDIVFAPVEGQEAALAQAGQDYPGCAVVPLIDAVRSLEDIIHDSIATRLDIFATVAELVDLKLLVRLDRDDLLQRADFFAGQQDFKRAAQLYRKVLAQNLNNPQLAQKLAHCLEQIGDAPEAANCYSQLALGHLEEGAGDAALACARKAVELAPASPTQLLALVRCLVSLEKTNEGVAELRRVVKIYQDQGRLEDARNTCLKILELEPGNDEVRRELARIFSQAENDPGAEDVVICIQCGEINDREAAACNGCKASLRLSCQSCGRVVAVSDRLCIFCGANPHTTGRHAKEVSGSPATSRIVDTAKLRRSAVEKGSQFWRSKLETHLQSARALEKSGDFDAALKEWKEVANFQADNPELTQHIREIEARVHDDFIEKQIERGHHLRRRRQFFTAAKAYKAALRGLPDTDPRVAPLSEILASTTRSHQRISVIYGASFLILCAIGFLAMKPRWDLGAYQTRVAAAARQVDALGALDGSVAISQIGGIADLLTKLESDAAGLGKGKVGARAQASYSELHGAFEVARDGVAAKALTGIKELLAHRDPAAETQLNGFRTAFGADFQAATIKPLADQIDQLKKELASVAQANKDAPAQLVKAKELEKAGQLGQAYALYCRLAEVKHEKVGPEAKVEAERLASQNKQFSDAWDEVGSLMTTDLTKADGQLAKLGAAAKIWDREADYDKRKNEIAARLATAGAEYQKLGAAASEAALEQFATAYRAAPQAAQAQVRLGQLRNFSKSRSEALARFKALMEARSYEQAWQAGRAFLTNFPTGLKPGEIALPLSITTAPAGAVVTIGNERQGPTPITITYDPAAKFDVHLNLAGYRPVTKPLAELIGDWHWQMTLEREPVWSLNLGKIPGLAMGLSDGGVMLGAGDALCRIDHKGALLWRRGLNGGDDLVDTSKVQLNHLPLVLGDGRYVVGLADKGVVVLDDQGKTLDTLPSNVPVRGQPLIYINEISGGQTRLAYAGDTLRYGVIGGEFGQVPLGGAALAGPIAVAKDLDRVLVVATLQGHLRGIEDSTHKQLWDIDLVASEVSQLVPTGDGGMVTVLDGSRLVCFNLTGSGANQRWTQELGAAAVGSPAIANDVVCLAAGSMLFRQRLNGAPLPSLRLPSPATSPVAESGDLLAVGCKGGELVLFKAGKPEWVNPCPAPVTAVCFSGGLIVVGLGDGTVTAFNP